tara:strand:+ start:611 stop:862 length:252 start_codon:yes stop_codon:yes gene_type:complete
MAEFSKQYCQATGFDFYDFDIEEIFRDIKEGYYVSRICEGFGSTGILNKEGVCHLIFMDDETESVTTKSLSQVIGEYRQKRSI